jgi:hypothetical protein
MLVGYAVYDLWPESCWPKTRDTTVPQDVRWVKLRGNRADADRIADFLIREQEFAATKRSRKLTVASRILWWSVDIYTDRNVKVALAMKASTAMPLKPPQEETHLR